MEMGFGDCAHLRGQQAGHSSWSLSESHSTGWCPLLPPFLPPYMVVVLGWALQSDLPMRFSISLPFMSAKRIVDFRHWRQQTNGTKGIDLVLTLDHRTSTTPHHTTQHAHTHHCHSQLSAN